MRSSVWRRPGSSSTMRIFTTRARAEESRSVRPRPVPAAEPGSKSRGGAAFTCLTHPNGAAEPFDDTGDDRETETGSLARFFRGKERVEDSLRLAPRNARAAVGNDQRDDFAQLADGAEPGADASVRLTVDGDDGRIV